jgi:hypothetical protein
LRYQEILEACWKGYRQAGMKDKGGRQVPNCVPVSEQEMEEDLKKWFKEKWVRFGPDGKIRGDCARGSSSEGKPKCLPQAKAQALGKKGRASSAAKKRREDPNPERRGAARNVATRVGEASVTKKPQPYNDPDWWKTLSPEQLKKLGGPRYNKNKKEKQDVKEGIPFEQCPSCGGPIVHESQINEKQDACYHKVKSRYKVWPSAYASGALVQCRKKGAANWGNKDKK